MPKLILSDFALLNQDLPVPGFADESRRAVCDALHWALFPLALLHVLWQIALVLLRDVAEDALVILPHSEGTPFTAVRTV